MKRLLRPKGFSLAELLVAMAALSSITAAMVGIYSCSVKSYETTNAKLILQAKAREAVRRIGPMLVSAGRENVGVSAILHPPAPDELRSNEALDRVVFKSSEDFLSEPSSTTRSKLWDEMQVERFTHRISLDPSGPTQLWLEKGSWDGNPLYAVGQDGFTPLGTAFRRRIVSGENNRALFANFRVQQLTMNGVLLQLTMIGPRYKRARTTGNVNLVARWRHLQQNKDTVSLNDEFVTYTAESIIQMPAVNP